LISDFNSGRDHMVVQSQEQLSAVTEHSPIRHQSVKTWQRKSHWQIRKSLTD